jgi:hypothetical protein
MSYGFIRIKYNIFFQVNLVGFVVEGETKVGPVLGLGAMVWSKTEESMERRKLLEGREPGLSEFKRCE